MVLQNLFLGSMIILGQSSVIEQDRIFVFDYINSLFSGILEGGLALNQGLLAQ